MKVKGYQEILYKGKVIAMLFKKELGIEGVRFFTSELNPFQVGVHKRADGVKLQPHYHVIDTPPVIYSIQEVLVVLEGKIRVTLYTKKGKVIIKKMLQTGDGILLMDQAHGVDFLTDSRVFEVKQGPYPGTRHAKIYLSRK